MRALLYLRKSTDEHQADSISTQEAGAREFCAAQGWTIVDRIVDEGESRAEFKKRPGFARLLARASSKTRDFDVVVARDESRLGSGERLIVALDDIIAAGVEVWYYATKEKVQLDSSEARIVHSVRAIVADAERAKIGGRTREVLELKARRGLNVGGRCYGFDNVVVRSDDGKKYTEYKVNAAEAAIVVELWERFAAGESERAIARDLNARGIASPRAGRRGTGSWSPNCVREIVRRDRYRGILEWGRVGAKYSGGTRVSFERKVSERVVVERPELRIVADELHERVQARIALMKVRSGGDDGYRGRSPRYLLSGRAVSRCAECGGPMQVNNSKQGPRIIRVYQCAWARDRGASVCKNTLRRPVDAVDASFISWMNENLLTENVILSILAKVRERIAERASASTSEADHIETQLKDLDKEIKRLVSVAARLDDEPEELSRAIATAQARRRELRASHDAMKVAPSVIDLEVRRIEAETRKQLANLKATLAAEPEKARRVVESVIAEPITFTPKKTTDGMRYQLSARMSADSLMRIEGDPDGI